MTRLTGVFYPELLEKVLGYLRANRLEIPEDPSAWLQDEMCNQNAWGEETCRPYLSEEPEGASTVMLGVTK